MSLLNLVHQSVVVRFTGAAGSSYDPAVGYVYRLTGVDGMGFLQLQDLRIGADEEHETISEPYWINKDLVREIHDYVSATGKDKLKFTGEPSAKAAPEPSLVPPVRDVPPKPLKSKKSKTPLL